MNPDSAAFIRAIKGPVMMITVGVLFALDNFTSLTFGRTWPVLLVVAGLLSLGRSAYGKGPLLHGRARYQAKWGPPQPVAPPPPPPPNPTDTSTAGPGTYRGSTYESAPASPSRSAEARRPDTASTADDHGAAR